MRWLWIVGLLSIASVTQAQGVPRLATGARPSTLSEQLRLRDSQVDILREERARKRLGGPIAALVVSSGVLSTWFGMFAMEAEIGELPTAVLSTVGVIGIVGTVSASVWLGRVVHERRVLRHEIRRLQHKRFDPPRLSVSLGPKQTGVTYTLRF